ncbi:uncharacterized protein DUF3618 [Williamsia limnetica]|uniref:Uncharacterized protein DUF3618 n=1 Tax=Williamsia limnetica TaxID=882452 RepID=A0A318RQ99_WILLI|nr:DUF3618 domain-containing protein [Williamsia limnetica]PYE17367.1 uncharacterized protein DUF3618 [Williamsia limnetica]
MTSSSDPDQIRADIERTRATLSSDVNTLAYEANPTTMARRKVGRVTGTLGSVREKVMGSASDTAQSTSDATSSALASVSDTAHSATDAVQSAPGAVKAQTQGNPLAAGLIAFGAGLLVSALIPASEREQQAAAALQEKAQPLTDEVTDIAKETAQNLQEPAQQAAASVKDTATGAAATVKDEGTSAAQDVQDHAQNATSTVADQQR